MTLDRKEPLLHVENIEKYYGNPGAVTKALDQVSFDVQAGEFISIMGGLRLWKDYSAELHLHH